MERSKTQELVRRLNMDVELALLLDSNEGYERFEKAISIVLDKKPPKIVQGISRYHKWSTPSYFKSYREEYLYRKGVSEDIYFRAVEEFKEFYGMGTPAKTREEIAKRKDLTSTKIAHDIDVVEMILAQRYKQDIWYGTL